MATQAHAEHQRRFAVNEQDYPFADHWFEHRGTAMHYVDESEGTPVLMLHGNPTWSYLYRDIIKNLRLDYRCIAPDYPGFGLSETPPGYGFTPQEHSNWIADLIDDLALDKYVLVIQDWGGPIGLAAALKHPERLAGILLLNTWAWKPDTAGWLFSHTVGSTPAKYLQTYFNLFTKRLVSAGISHQDRKTPGILSAYTAPFTTPDSRMGTWVFPWAISHSDEWLQSIQANLYRLRDKPVGMVWGMRDMAFGNERYIEQWRRYFPNAPVVRIADANHNIQEDSPEQVVKGVKRLINRIQRAAMVQRQQRKGANS